MRFNLYEFLINVLALIMMFGIAAIAAEKILLRDLLVEGETTTLTGKTYTCSDLTRQFK